MAMRHWLMGATACLGIGAVGVVIAIGFATSVRMAARTVADFNWPEII